MNTTALKSITVSEGSFMLNWFKNLFTNNQTGYQPAWLKEQLKKQK